MTSIIERRLSLHQTLARKEQENAALKLQNLQLQTLANLGSATAMIAHEINNLLTPLSSYAALAAQNPNDKALVAKVLDRTRRNCQRASKIMQSLLGMADGQKQQQEEVSVKVLVEEVFTGLCRDFTKDGITVEVRIPEDLRLRCIPVQMQQVLMNLILNARDAMLGRGGFLRVLASRTADSVDIEVRDTGEGITPENLKSIFRPFFTTKSGKDRPAGGSGVGLAFCRRIVDAHGGTIRVESQPGKGSTFRVRLPGGP
ncbi:MAG: HAMP domain-containing histidine kinase [Sedimentisphaerales bacterium]|nr:HAMP domain-containing histidine kinase [Sedimentisphaerales bacterium]